MIEDGGRSRGNPGHRGTAFYIEALLLVGVFTIVVLILTRVFAWSGQLGREAALLTDAVQLAQNGAEAVAASRSLEEVQALLEENGNAQILGEAVPEGDEAAGESDSEGNGTRTLRVHYDDEMNPAPDGAIWMDIRWAEASSGEETEAALGEAGLVKSVITVNRAGRTEPVYTLETEVFVGVD